MSSPVCVRRGVTIDLRALRVPSWVPLCWARRRLEQQKHFWLLGCICKLCPWTVGKRQAKLILWTISWATLSIWKRIHEEKKTTKFWLPLQKKKVKKKKKKESEGNPLALGTSPQMKMPGWEAIVQRTTKVFLWRRGSWWWWMTRYYLGKKVHREKKRVKDAEFPPVGNGPYQEEAGK